MSFSGDHQGAEGIELSDPTLKAIIEGVAARLQEASERSGSRSGDDGQRGANSLGCKLGRGDSAVSNYFKLFPLHRAGVKSCGNSARHLAS